MKPTAPELIWEPIGFVTTARFRPNRKVRPALGKGPISGTDDTFFPSTSNPS